MAGRARLSSEAVDFSRPRIERLLAAHRPDDAALHDAQQRAAVAAVLRFSSGHPELLLMQRARRENDRWSGQVSMPGGRAEPHDESLLATAIRETLEETGVDLATHATPLGRLAAVQAVARGRPLSMTVTPFVFALEREADLQPSEEAEALFWFPLAEAASGRLDGTLPYTSKDTSLLLPCWHFEGRVVWGMTHGMIRSLIRLFDT